MQKDCSVYSKVGKHTLQHFWNAEDDLYNTPKFNKVIYERLP
jgi:hypothetical protein